jgi:hypothetical protein
MFDIKVDKDLIEKRKEFIKSENTTEVTIEIEDSVYEKLEKISKDNNISIEDYLIYLIQEDLISKVDKPTGIHKVIDEAYLSLYIEELIDSKTNCLIVDINNFEPKCVLLINEDYEKLKKVED